MGNVFEGLGTVQKVRAMMAANHMTMQQTADYLGMSLGTIGNRFEKNDWSVAELKALADKFGVTLSDLA